MKSSATKLQKGKPSRPGHAEFHPEGKRKQKLKPQGKEKYKLRPRQFDELEDFDEFELG